MAEESGARVEGRIRRLKVLLGDSLFIPAHHYQRDEVVQFADYVGDSLELARVCAETGARFILFCGVRFMAEIARALVPEDKNVFMPVPEACCPLADFAPVAGVLELYDQLQCAHPDEFVSVAYANTHLEVKAFCGRHGGFVCTSSNARRVFEHVLGSGGRVFFVPDRNLGLNTAAAMGLLDETAVAGELTRADELRGRRIVVWDGHCSVHTRFQAEQVRRWRSTEPGARVMVHPECDPEVVAAADLARSTSAIKREVDESPEGSSWVIGTEHHFVARLQATNPGKRVAALDQSECRDMSLTTAGRLLTVLQRIAGGDLSNQVTVEDARAVEAGRAIRSMLDLG
ncbi:MAG: quinolinate synthase NadA [Spirochaetota bacterium]